MLYIPKQYMNKTYRETFIQQYEVFETICAFLAEYYAGNASEAELNITLELIKQEHKLDISKEAVELAGSLHPSDTGLYRHMPIPNLLYNVEHHYNTPVKYKGDGAYVYTIKSFDL